MSTTRKIPVPGERLGWLGMGVLAALIVAAFVGPALSPRMALGTDKTPEHTISVSGTGRVFLQPDVADVQVGVSITKPTVKGAREAAATAMTGVLAALRKAGIADRDIQTTILSLQPTYDYRDQAAPPRVTGYQLTNAVRATVRDLDALGEAIDAVLGAGATSLDGVVFRVDDPEQAEDQARTRAVAEAKAKAEALAGAAGASIVGVSSISESVAQPPYPYFAGGAIADKAAAQTPIQLGTSEVSVTVSVVYRIG